MTELQTLILPVLFRLYLAQCPAIAYDRLQQHPTVTARLAELTPLTA